MAAFLTGSLAIRIKNQAKQAAQSAYRTKVLFDTSQLLQQAKDKNEIVSTTSNQLIKLLGKDIVFYLADGEVLDTPHIFSVTEENLESCISENEKAVAGWVLKNNKRAGSTTGTLSNAKCLYLAVRSSSMVYGVVGIVMGKYLLIHLKTVFYCPFSENVLWLWKMRKMPVRNRRRLSLQKMNSCEQTCCVLFHMI